MSMGVSVYLFIHLFLGIFTLFVPAPTFLHSGLMIMAMILLLILSLPFSYFLDFFVIGAPIRPCVEVKYFLVCIMFYKIVIDLRLF